MSEPLVVAVCLTKNRPDMLGRALESFEVQTYKRKRLLIYDTASRPWEKHRGIGVQVWRADSAHLSVGMLRNEANEFAAKNLEADLIAHWDDDDWSHPERLSEQVRLIQATGADCVGYEHLLFWHAPAGEAFVYFSNFPNRVCGTSMLYRRWAWEARQFPNLTVGEDAAWQRGLRVRGVSSFPEVDFSGAPRMIASIHGRNTNTAYPRLLKGGNAQFQRAPEWDEHCARTMAIEVTA